MRKQAQVAGTSSHLGCLESCFQAVLELSVPEGPDSSLPRHRFFLGGPVSVNSQHGGHPIRSRRERVRRGEQERNHSVRVTDSQKCRPSRPHNCCQILSARKDLLCAFCARGDRSRVCPLWWLPLPSSLAPVSSAPSTCISSSRVLNAKGRQR